MLPYQGNKSKIAKDIVLFLRRSFPELNNFCDLFGGGGSITHIASKYYENILYNEIDTSICLAVESVINGTNFEHLPIDEWISRDKFFEEIIQPQSARRGLIECIWSFGNNRRGYIYGKDIEKWKCILHKIVWAESANEIESLLSELQESRLFKSNDLEYLLKFNNIKEDASALFLIPNKERRFNIKKLSINRITEMQSLQSLQSLERLERLQSLESLERLGSLESLGRLEITNLDYRNVVIPNNSIVYCDIPYNTKTSKGAYGITFDHDHFIKWAQNSPFTVVYSEYIDNAKMPIIWKKSKRNTLCNISNIKSTEVLCWNGKGIFNKTELF